MTPRGETTTDDIELLKRMAACNWEQLAKRLGVNPNTLKRWRDTEKGERGENCNARVRQLTESLLAAAGHQIKLTE